MMKLTLAGIDGFNRPVFKEIDKRNYYCFVDDLYGFNQNNLVAKNIQKGLHDATELYYKGKNPEGEPEYFVGIFGENTFSETA